MITRGFFAVVGLGAGLALGVWAIKKIERTQAQLQPGALAGSAAGVIEGAGARVREALEAGRAEAARTEVELRTRWGVTGA